MIFTLIVLALAAAGFVWGRLRSDLVALLALLALALSGILTVGEALSGFSNPIVIMMVGLFIVGGAIFKTGLAKMIGTGILRMAGKSETRLFFVVMAGTALIGGFVSNTGTVALMLPIVVSMASVGDISVRRLLMPLAFASSLGGMLTLIGTPPNLVIAEAWEAAGNGPLSFFSYFLPAGAICLVAGTLLLIPLSKALVKKKPVVKQEDKGRKSLDDLVSQYSLNADLCSVEISRASALAGKTLAGLNLRNVYAIDVLEVRRGEKSGHLVKKIVHSTPDPTAQLREGETMYLRGPKEMIERFAADYKVRVHRDESTLRFYNIGIAEIVPMPNSPILNKTVSALEFRTRYGVNVIGLRRKDEVFSRSIGDMKIKSGDVMLVQGSWKSIADLTHQTDDWVVLGQPLNQAAEVTIDYKAPVAALIMTAMVVALVFDFVPPVVSVLCASVLMIVCGCFRNVEEAYKTINWESVVLIAAMMPMSFALEKTGVSSMVAGALTHTLDGLGPMAVMAGIYAVTAIMTLFISNTATAVLMAPIAVSCASAMGVSALPLLFAVTYAASLCFASPFSTPPNALVMPAGQYTFTDYLKVGLPLQVLLGILMIFVIPMIIPF